MESGVKVKEGNKVGRRDTGRGKGRVRKTKEMWGKGHRSTEEGDKSVPY